MIVSYVQGALQKELLIAPVLECFESFFDNFIDTSNKIFNHCFFVDSLLIVSYLQGALPKEQGAAYCSFRRAF